MAQYALKPPTLASQIENRAQGWKDFIQEFELYLLVTDQDKSADVKKVALLLCCMRREYIKAHSTFQFAAPADKDK